MTSNGFYAEARSKVIQGQEKKKTKPNTFTGENFTRQYSIKEIISFSFTSDFKRSIDKTSEIRLAQDEVHSLCQFISVQKLTLQLDCLFNLTNITKIKELLKSLHYAHVWKDQTVLWNTNQRGILLLVDVQKKCDFYLLALILLISLSTKIYSTYYSIEQQRLTARFMTRMLFYL